MRNIDKLKEILVGAEAKGITTHKERDKKLFHEKLQLLVFSFRSKFITQIRKKKKTPRKRVSIHKNVLNAISQSELNILWRGRVVGVKFWASGINWGGGGNFWIHALSGRGTFFIYLSCLKNHRPPLAMNNEQSLTPIFSFFFLLYKINNMEVN